jgi:hypothetical protein
VKRHSVITGLFLAAAIPLLVVLCPHGNSPPRCSLDGSRIEPLYEVIVSQGDGWLRNFSCVRSAQIWLLENRVPISSLWVTDEATGEKIRSEQAYYVVSDLITTRHTGNRIHVFAQEKAARSHAGQYRGHLIENPLRVLPVKPARVWAYAPDGRDCPDSVSSSTHKPFCLTDNGVPVSGPLHAYASPAGLSQLCRGYSRVHDKPPERST